MSRKDEPEVEVAPRAGYVPASARFVYDTKDPSQRSPGAALRVNGTSVGSRVGVGAGSALGTGSDSLGVAGCGAGVAC